METGFTITMNSEIQETGSDEVIEIRDSPSPTDIRMSGDPKLEFSTDFFPGTHQEYSTFNSDQPIDLTFNKIHSQSENNVIGNPRKIIFQAKSSSSDTDKRSIQAFNQQNLLQLQRDDSRKIFQPSPHRSNYSYAIMRAAQPDLPINHFSNRQQEIMKMAKSIFSKRTRTLYYWMYPTASKQQIKEVVSNTWESMAAEEKNIYVAQVLARFGYNNANLMINPQLEQIKELPPVTGNVDFSVHKSSELQNAISSISNETEIIISDCSGDHSRKKPRISKKRIAQNISAASHEFGDDLELSREFAQFSKIYKNQL